jgi:hypothetical protein
VVEPVPLAWHSADRVP